MPVTEIAGNFSGFGDQLSSRRTTFPKYSQLTGRRVIGVNPQCEEAFLQWVKGSGSGSSVELPVLSSSLLVLLLNLPLLCRLEGVIYNNTVEYRSADSSDDKWCRAALDPSPLATNPMLQG